ncbi:MAG: hypothetical protein IT374_10240 [Polyangiaceae bacterium]|nr:hypothetical protein [Polyangiaceae bacterium]
MTSAATFPEPADSDAEEVSWALSTGQAMWKRGDHAEAIRWVKRASDSAADAGDDDRAFTLARAAAELKEATGALTVPPPPAAPAPAPSPAAPAPAPTARVAPPPPARGSGSVAPAARPPVATAAKPAAPSPATPAPAPARPSTGTPAPPAVKPAAKAPAPATGRPATTTPLPGVAAQGATATPVPGAVKPAPVAQAARPVGGRPVGSIGARGADATATPAPRGPMPTPTEEHAAPTFSDDLDAPTMMLSAGDVGPEHPTKAFPKDTVRELTSTHVWIFRDESGTTRLVARSGRRPAGALDAVMVTSDGAALSTMLDEA